MTFEALTAFVLQSTAVALIALAIERFLVGRQARVRRLLWAVALVAAILAPAGLALIERGDAPRAATLVVFNVEALGRSAPAEAKAGALGAVVVIALLLAGWRLCGLWRLGRYVAAAQPLARDATVASDIAAVEERVGARADYRASAAVESPLVYGYRKPVVVLPAGFGAMPRGQRIAILAHELTHVRRRDWLKLLFEEALRCATWFTPAIHVILRKMRVAREMATDEAALEATRDADSYLEALVEIARRPIQADALVAPLFLEPRSLEQRVAALLEEHSMSESRRILALAAVLFLLPVAGRWARDAFPAALRAAEGTVHRVGGGVTAPRLLHKVEPEYTDEAREADLNGTVVLSIEVHPDGKAYNVQVERGLGAGLDEAAVQAIEQWEFEPGKKAGKPVTVAARVEVSFSQD